MQYRQLGKAGARVSAIGLGSYLTIGMSINDKASHDTVRRAYELGINFFDTANAYAHGAAEEMLGQCLPEFERSSIFLASKVWAPMGDGPNDRGINAKHIHEQCNASLKRLKTDYLDLYQCHRPDPDTPIAETVRAMDDLARAGKIIYWGVSEWPAWLIQKAVGIAKEIGARPPVSNQPRYSMLFRRPESELFQFCASEGIGNVVFSPLAHGILTGKYAPGQPAPEGTRAADPEQNMVIKAMYWKDEYLEKAARLPEMAGDLGCTAAQLSLAWVLRRSEVSSAIMGASKVSQVEDNAAAADVVIPEDVLATLDDMFPGPGVAYKI